MLKVEQYLWPNVLQPNMARSRSFAKEQKRFPQAPFTVQLSSSIQSIVFISRSSAPVVYWPNSLN